MRRLFSISVSVVAVASAVLLIAADKPNRQGGQRGLPASEFHATVPEHPLDVILARPTADSVTISVLCYQDAEGHIIFGTQTDQLTEQTPLQKFKAGVPAEIVLRSLKRDTQYFYEFRSAHTNLLHGTFHTARPAGSTFNFTIQADSHLDSGTSPEVYLQSLTNALAAQPDFHIDLGDTFMTEKFANFHEAAPQYLAQRYFFGIVGRSAPVFLTLGNHDGEMGRYLDGTATNMTVWANAQRKKYFPNPRTDSFYSGNATPEKIAGPLENYYAWQWGDALFVVLDPFWFTPRARGGSDNWYRTLGRTQYDWLKRTLETSHAKYKFIFIHHLVGGETREGRGGAEAAKFFEWGGLNLDGTNEFAIKRSGWPMPIHQLLVQNKVSAVFHGHDHLYARQELDGIIYQEVPQPSHLEQSARSAVEYGYKQGVILPSPGILRVKISADQTQVEYVRIKQSGSSEVADHYTIPLASIGSHSTATNKSNDLKTGSEIK